MTGSRAWHERPDRSPAPVRTVVIVMAVLAVGLLLIAVDNLAAGSTGPDGQNVGYGPLVLSGLMGWTARGLSQGRRGPRIITYVIFGFTVMTGVGIVRTGPLGVGLFGLLPIALGVLVIVLLAVPDSSRQWFTPGEHETSSGPPSAADGGERLGGAEQPPGGARAEHGGRPQRRRLLLPGRGRVIPGRGRTGEPRPPAAWGQPDE
jgi:hypothetical protein